MSYLDKFLAPFQIALKQTIESYIRLETADDEHTFAAMDGSLVTLMRLDGSRQIIGEQEYKNIITGSTIKIGSRFDRQGHALQIYFVRDPGRIIPALRQQIRPSMQSAKNSGLELDDLFEERVRHLSNFLAHEECYFVLWTRPSILTKAELERSVADSKEQGKKIFRLAMHRMFLPH